MDLLSEYSVAGGQSITRGTTVAPYTITPTVATTATITDKSIAKELAAQVTAGNLPAVVNDATGSPNTLYVLFFPSGVVVTDATGAKSCVDYCGYHSSGTISGQTYVYAVIPDLSEVETYPHSDGGSVTEPCGYGCTYQGKTKPEVDWFTGTISHEVAEAVTDPVGGSGWYDHANSDFACGGAQSMNPPIPGGGEVGDVCIGFWDDEYGTGSCEDTLPIAGKNIAAQQMWSNALSGCYVSNPATPAKCPPMGCVDGGPGPLTPLLDAGPDDDGGPSDASGSADSTVSDAGKEGGSDEAGAPSNHGTGSGTGTKSGCSCTTAGSAESSSLALGGALAGLALALGRRRSRLRCSRAHVTPSLHETDPADD
jgi:MYXO-CTERM domain-containing protein